MLESLNGGKPIKESRDVDLPLAAAHFFYYAGWADKLEYAFANRRPRAVRRLHGHRAVELPVPHGGLEDRARDRRGEPVVLKPASFTSLSAIEMVKACAEADIPAGVVNLITGPGGSAGRRVGAASARRQGRVHRLDRGRAAHHAARVGHREEGDARARRQVGEHRPRRRRPRPRGRGNRKRDLLQPGSRLLRRLAPVRARVDLRDGRRQAQAQDDDIARRRSARQEHRRRRDQLADAARQDRGARGCRAGRRSRDLPAAMPPARAGLLVRSTVFTKNITQSYRIAQEIFGPVLSVLTFRTPDEAVEKANNTPYGLSAGIWSEKGSRILWMAERLRAGVVWANTFNRFDPASPFGGYRSLASGAKAACTGWSPISPSTTEIRLARPGDGAELMRIGLGDLDDRDEPVAASGRRRALLRGANEARGRARRRGRRRRRRLHLDSAGDRAAGEQPRPARDRARGRSGVAGSRRGAGARRGGCGGGRATGRPTRCACSARTPPRGGSTIRAASWSRACFAASSTSAARTSTTSSWPARSDRPAGE